MASNRRCRPTLQNRFNSALTGVLPRRPLNRTELRIRFGLKLKALRAEMGMSQEALANEADLARSYVGEVETGRRNISLLNICRLATALTVAVAVRIELLRWRDAWATKCPR